MALSMHDEEMVDQLAMALFGVVEQLPANQRRALLGVIAGHLHGMCGKRAHATGKVVHYGGKSQTQTASKCRAGPRPEGRPKRRVSSSSTTYVANSSSRSRVRWAGTSTLETAAAGERTTCGLPYKQTALTDDEMLEELRCCAQNLGDDLFGYDEYRYWALAQQATNPDRAAVLIDVVDLIDRFGSFPRARIAAGLEHLPRRFVKDGNEDSFVACVSALQAAADEIGIMKMLSAREYMQWRGTHLEDKVGRRVLPAPPEWGIISDRFGAWPRALSAAGLISQQEATDREILPGGSRGHTA